MQADLQEARGRIEELERERDQLREELKLRESPPSQENSEALQQLLVEIVGLTIFSICRQTPHPHYKGSLALP